MQRNSLVRPIAAILIGMCAIQLGASLAKGLFGVMGAIGATTLRLLLAALMLGVVFRPWQGAPLRGQWPAIAGYGVAVGFMNLFYDLALNRLPMGVVVAVEFIGPLAVAIYTSRRALDLSGWRWPVPVWACCCRRLRARRHWTGWAWSMPP